MILFMYAYLMFFGLTFLYTFFTFRRDFTVYLEDPPNFVGYPMLTVCSLALALIWPVAVGTFLVAKIWDIIILHPKSPILSLMNLFHSSK